MSTISYDVVRYMPMIIKKIEGETKWPPFADDILKCLSGMKIEPLSKTMVASYTGGYMRHSVLIC